MANILDFFFFTPAEPLKIWNVSEHETRSAPRIWRISIVFSLVVIALQTALYFHSATDYVGLDNDDSMRLVEVRDFLAGQVWFDLHQYRLGPDGGTLMHWSRLVDLPIAVLIKLFSLFFNQQAAEAIALAIWPQILIFPLMAAIALAAFRLGGRNAMLIGLTLAACMLFEQIRFRPGAIDHHNVQMVLIATIAAMLLDPARRASSFAFAGLAAATALAIGAETTPIIAVCCIIVALLWAVDGKNYQAATFAFSTSLAVGSALLFLATTPPVRYLAVTCDNFSFGYFSTTLTGAVLLALSSALLSARPAIIRLAALGAIGIAAGIPALGMLSHCIVDPLGDLDPLLVKLWLNKVTEARSIITMLESQPAHIGSFYAVGFLAIATCCFRILHDDRRTAHAILLALLAISWTVTLIQIRGYMFSNMLGIIALAPLVSDLRDLHFRHPANKGAAFAFVLSAFVSIPFFWTIAGGVSMVAAEKMGVNVAAHISNPVIDRQACVNDEVMTGLAGLPRGRVMASSNFGSMLLRKTPHQVLTAPYHRNQSGMLAEMRASIATPAEAETIIRQAGVNILFLCKADSQSSWFAKQFPTGLYAGLGAGQVPAYLELQPAISNDGVAIYKVRPTP